MKQNQFKLDGRARVTDTHIRKYRLRAAFNFVHSFGININIFFFFSTVDIDNAQKDPGEGLPMNDAADIEGFLVGFSSICFLEFFGMRLV